ncbi:hypothetical protein [Pseudomonas coronafaciens]|uniref:hypothetical protein n=1 Tax=Pseudomonas coronafaciens TaxID=53409 RepID=UPI001E5E94E1|nr:hypothetical protein [Pseudomonas coronafaciens]
MAFNQLVVGSNPTRPTISKIWKAHENADFQVFFCVADRHGQIAPLRIRHGVEATICKTVGKSFEAEGRRYRLSAMRTQTSSRLSRNIAPASRDLKLQGGMLLKTYWRPGVFFILTQCVAVIGCCARLLKKMRALVSAYDDGILDSSVPLTHFEDLLFQGIL